MYGTFNIKVMQVPGASFRGPHLTLNKKSSSHSLQFALKYHVFLNSLRPQIWEHTHRSSGLVKYYVFLDSLRLQIRKHTHCSLVPAKYHVFLDSLHLQVWEHTHRNSGPAALYYTAVELEKM